jgi:hypothetical protein
MSHPKSVPKPRYVLRVNGERVATFRKLWQVRAFVRHSPEPVTVRVVFPDLRVKTLVHDSG